MSQNAGFIVIEILIKRCRKSLLCLCEYKQATDINQYEGLHILKCMSWEYVHTCLIRNSTTFWRAILFTIKLYFQNELHIRSFKRNPAYIWYKRYVLSFRDHIARELDNRCMYVFAPRLARQQERIFATSLHVWVLKSIYLRSFSFSQCWK